MLLHCMPIGLLSEGGGKGRREGHHVPSDGAQMLPIPKPSDRVCVHKVRDETELCCIDDPITVDEGRRRFIDEMIHATK